MLSLSLTSLSTARDADATQQKFHWQKYTDDLTFVIDSYGARDNTQLIKVVQGTEVRVRDTRPMPHPHSYLPYLLDLFTDFPHAASD